MIEAKQLGPRDPYRIYLNGQPVCQVFPLLLEDGSHDWPATKRRAELIARSLHVAQAFVEFMETYEEPRP